MSSGAKTSSGAGLGFGLLALVLMTGALAVVALHDRDIPPTTDPFIGDDKIYEVMFRVQWWKLYDDPSQPERTQNISYEAGDDRDDPRDVSTNPWEYVTTARSGTELVLFSTQSGPGDVVCQIYVNDVEVDVDVADDTAGCFALYRIP